MNKEFVSYEQSLALKELGFDEPCFGYYYPYYYNDRIYFEGSRLKVSNDCNNLALVKAPLYQQAFRWFREKYNLLGYVSQATISKGKVFMFTCNEGNDTLVEDIDSDFKTYEEAELVCLKNLIEIVKEKK
jgi:hypothetical protein